MHMKTGQRPPRLGISEMSYLKSQAATLLAFYAESQAGNLHVFRLTQLGIQHATKLRLPICEF